MDDNRRFVWWIDNQMFFYLCFINEEVKRYEAAEGYVLKAVPQALLRACYPLADMS